MILRPPRLVPLATLLVAQAALWATPSAAEACIWYCPGPLDVVGEVGTCSSPGLVATDSPILVEFPDRMVQREGLKLKLHKRSGEQVASTQALLATTVELSCQSQWWRVQPEQPLESGVTYEVIANGGPIASFQAGVGASKPMVEGAAVQLFSDKRWFNQTHNSNCPEPPSPGRYWTAHVSISATAQLPVKVTVTPSIEAGTFPNELVVVARPGTEQLVTFAVLMGTEPCFNVVVETLAGVAISHKKACKAQRCIAEREFVFNEDGPRDERLELEHWAAVSAEPTNSADACMELPLGTRPAAIEAAKPQEQIYCHTIDAPQVSSDGCASGNDVPQSGAMVLLLWTSWLLWRTRRNGPIALGRSA